jgi:hypothetical protein
MANTPMTELVLMHRRYWCRTRELKNKVPSLGIAIINLHSSTQNEIPQDHDGVVNRNVDVTFSDRTHKDEETLLLISDYIDLVKDLINLATQNGAGQETINNILERKIRFHSTLTRPRLY